MKLRTLLLLVPAGAVVLTGCSSDHSSQDTSSPPPLEQVSPSADPQLNSTASPSSSAEAPGQPAMNTENTHPIPADSDMDQIVAQLNQDAPKVMSVSSDRIKQKLLDPYFEGDQKAMPWLVLFSVGAHMDMDKIQSTTGKFSTDIIDPNNSTVLAHVSGDKSDKGIKPLSFELTDAGRDFENDHAQELMSYATN